MSNVTSHNNYCLLFSLQRCGASRWRVTAISRPGGYAEYKLASNRPKLPKKPQAAARQIVVTLPK